MSAISHPSPTIDATTGARALVDVLLANGISAGFGIPSIHNIALYEVLRQQPRFRHWLVRHEQAAGFAADGFYRRTGRAAAIFASTGPGNLFTLVPLLESLQAQVPLVLIGTNIASGLQSKTGGGLHEIPQQLEIIRPLTRFARRINSPDEIPEVVREAAAMLHGPLPGPAFIEVPHDLLLAPFSIPASLTSDDRGASPTPNADLSAVIERVVQAKRPVVLVGGAARNARHAVQSLAEKIQAPVLTTTSGKGLIPADHPLAFGCISRGGAVAELLTQCDLMLSFGARLTEFDTGQFRLPVPQQHLQVVAHNAYAGTRFPSELVVGDISHLATQMTEAVAPRGPWCSVPELKAQEETWLAGVGGDPYAALMVLRSQLHREDIVVNDQSILNYWAAAFFPVFAPGTFLYPWGSGTLGYALPAAIGAACAGNNGNLERRIICIAGDGGFQYTHHELATVAQYKLPIKILLVNDDAYGVIGFLQRTMFGQTHEVDLQEPDFCRLAGAYGIAADRANSFDELRAKMAVWLDAPGPALLEWHTKLKAPWEAGAVPRPASVQQK